MTTTKRINPINSVLSVRSIRAALLAMALLAMVLVGMAVGLTPAEAQEAAGEQEPQFLVSNLGVGMAGSGGIQHTLSASRPGFAQAFTTGAETGGYALGSLGIQVSNFYDVSTVGDHLQVTINGVASGSGPGDALCTLTNPSSFSTPGVIAFEAPTGAGACPQLATETTYFVVIEWVNPSGTGAFALIPQTYPTEESAAGEEDPCGAEGWSIADQSYYLSVSSNARIWTAFVYTASFDAAGFDAASFKIAVREAALTGAQANSQARCAPVINGIVRVGETLTANTAAIADEDGLEKAVFSYQWVRNDGTADTHIADAAGVAYTLVSDDEGKTIKVEVSFTDDEGNPETLTSDPTGKVAAALPEEVSFSTHEVTEEGIELIWNSNSNSTETEYVLYRSVLPHERLSEYATVPRSGNSTSFIDADVESGLEYLYRVTGVNSDGEGPKSDPVRLVVPGERLEAPADLAAVYTEQGMEVTWSAPTNAGITDYQVYRGKFLNDGGSHDGAASKYVKIPADGDPMTYLDTNVEEGAKYRYRVAAVNATGEGFKTTWLDVQATISETEVTTSATGLPTIDGAARVGETLTADTSGIDDDGLTNVAFAYQWLRSDGSGDSNIQDATGSTYTLTGEDEGRTVKVTVSFTNREGNPESLTSDPTGEVAPESGPLTAFTLVDTSTDPDKMLGTLEDGIALTLAAPAGDSYGIRVDTESNDDIHKVVLALSGAKDVSRPEKYSPYSLYGDSGADNLTGEDLPAGSYDLKATAYDANNDEMGTLKVSFSVAYADLAEEQPPAQNTSATGAPTISGKAQVGETLTADTTGIDDDDGLENAAFTYQWTRSDGGSDSNIQDATGSSYILTEDDEGRTIKVTVSFTDAQGNSETLTSDPTGEVEAKPNTRATGAPTIDGIARVGETLTADMSGIDDDDGLTNVVFAYQWIRNDGTDDTEIAGATGADYTLTGDDEGKTIKVAVSFTDGEGNPESLTSDPTGEVAPESGPLTAFTLVDTSTDPDTPLGTLEDGRTLTLAAPPGDSYGIRVDTDSNHDDHDDIRKVELALSGAKTEGKTEWEPPYSLYGDSGADNLTGESLPAGSYDLTATAYDANGDLLGTLEVSFSVAYAAPAEEQQPARNTLATGAPTIDGIARVGETLTVDTSGIHDDDGLTNPGFTYQWIRNDGTDDTEIAGATGADYTLTGDDEGKTVKVTVFFTDAEGNPETLTSDPTGEVEAKPNTRATGLPTIDGAARVGETLTADTSGIDDDDGLDNVAFSYQWLRDDAEIAGATGSSYTLSGDDQGGTIKVTVSFTDGEGSPETLTSDPTGEVAPESGPLTAFTLVDTSTDPDKVLGTLEDGIALTLAAPPGDSYGIRVDTDSSHDDHDDIRKVELALSGAKDEGKTEWEPPYSLYGDSGADNLTGESLPAGSYDLTATAYDANDDLLGTLEVSFSVAYAAPAEEQQPARNTLATGAPNIDGTARVGETLTADTSGIADDDGLENVAFSYQWLRSDGGLDTNITGATGSTYTLVKADEGKTVKVTVSFTDAEGNPETLTSDPTGEVEAKPNTEPTGAPTIHGIARVGETLTADTSGIDDDDGLTDVAFAYQWVRNDGSSDSNIQDATGSSYVLVKADEGMTIKVKVSFTDAEGNPETLTSDPTGEVEAKPNTEATGAPTIDGFARVGETLTADTSGIHDDDELTNVVFSYQWLRNGGSGDTNIQDATGSTYTLTEDDEGRTIKVTVSFTDAEGNAESLTSDPTGEVDSEAGPLTGFTLVDAADPDQTVLWKHQTDGGTPEDGDTWKEWTDGGTLTLGDPDNGSYGITVETESGEQIASVRLELTGDEKSVDRTDDAAPYSLFGDEGEDALHGEGLPAGSYTLKATAYTEDDEILGTLEISFSVVAVTKPGRPQDLDGEASAQGIALTWEAPSGSAVTQYVVYRGELVNGSMNGRPMVRYATIDATGAAMQYTDANVEAGKEYRYRVAAVNSAGEGKKSTWINIFAEDS